MLQFCADFKRSENVLMDPERVCQPCRRLPGIEGGGLERRGGDSTAPPVKSSYENLTGSLKQALWSPKKYPSLDQMHEPTDSCSFQSDDGAPRVVWNPRIMLLCFSISASLEECPMTPLTSPAKFSAWGGWSSPRWPPTRMSHQDGEKKIQVHQL